MTSEIPQDKEVLSAIAEAEAIISRLGLINTFSEGNVPSGIKTFSPEALRSLEAEGTWRFGTLNGETIKDLRGQGFHFWSDWHRNLPEIEEVPALKTQIAVNFQSFIIPGTVNKSREEQLYIIADLERKIQERIPDIRFISPKATDGAVMLTTGLITYDRDLRPRSFRSTSSEGSDSITLLMSSPSLGMHINRVPQNARYADLYMGAVVVPK